MFICHFVVCARRIYRVGRIDILENVVLFSPEVTRKSYFFLFIYIFVCACVLFFCYFYFIFLTSTKLIERRKHSLKLSGIEYDFEPIDVEGRITFLFSYLLRNSKNDLMDFPGHSKFRPDSSSSSI